MKLLLILLALLALTALDARAATDHPDGSLTLTAEEVKLFTHHLAMQQQIIKQLQFELGRTQPSEPIVCTKDDHADQR